MTESRDPLFLKLKSEILLAPISDLEEHIKRGSLLILHPQVNLAQCAFDIASDNKDAIQELLAKQYLLKAEAK